jgi:hypothetical protein
LGYSAVQRARMRGMQDDALTRMTAMDLHQLSTAPEPTPAEAPPVGG